MFLEFIEGVFKMDRSHPKQMWPFLWKTTRMNIFHIFKHSFQLKWPCASAAMRRCYSIPLKWMKQWHATMQLTGIKTTGKMTDYRGNWWVYMCASLLYFTWCVVGNVHACISTSAQIHTALLYYNATLCPLIVKVRIYLLTFCVTILYCDVL